MFLTKGTKQHTDDSDSSRKSWTHMVLHCDLSNDEDGFGVTFNNQDSVSWSSSPSVLLRDIHNNLSNQLF